MKVTRQLTISIPPPVAWKFLHDVSAATACLPGMEYRGQSNEGHHSGRIAMKVGPFQATFEGEGHVTYDDQQYSMHIDGKGVDRKGGSRSKISMICRLSDAGANRTSLEIDADVQLSGAIAQFGRTGLINEVANLFIQDFARKMEQRLTAVSPMAPELKDEPAPLSGIRLIWLAFVAWVKKLLLR